MQPAAENPIPEPAGPSVGLVIPAYREAEVLHELLAQIQGVFGNGGTAARLRAVLVVDDGSPEAEARVMRAAVEESARQGCPAAWMVLGKNHGKGRAVREGWQELAKDCDLLAFLDADGAVSAAEFARCLVVAADKPGTAVFGSRVKMRGRRVERGFKRHVSGRLFATLVGLLVDPEVYDSQCGCKILPAKAFLSFAGDLREDGFVFDVEVLAALNHAKVPVIEVPVDWHDKPDSKVRLLRDSLRMFRGLLRIRRRFLA